MTSKPIRVLLSDDHTLVREGLRSLLTKIPNVSVVAETGNGQEALAFAKKLQPDIAILDISMPGLNGLELAERLRKEIPNIHVIILSMHAQEDFVRKALRVGAVGYILKNASPTELEDALKSALKGEYYLSNQISKHVIGEYIRGTLTHNDTKEELTSRQREILQLIAEGHSTKEIATLLQVSTKTVETHRLQLMERLHIHDIPGLVRYAIRIGLVSSDR